MSAEVLVLADLGGDGLVSLLAHYGLQLCSTPPGHAIPGSYWGDSEAGLRGSAVYARPDTPVHSILHESCHYLCLSPDRRADLDTNAGGDYDEENAVCYLQIVLSDQLPGVGRRRIQRDMDVWGYTFRLGSARAWFDQDAHDARDWLIGHGLIDRWGQPTWRMRQAA